MDSPSVIWNNVSIFYEGGTHTRFGLPRRWRKHAMTTPFQTLLLTGAAGFVGRHLAPALLPLTVRLRVSDLPAALPVAALPTGAELVPCDLADAAAVHTLLSGVDAVVHLGGVSVEGPFEPSCRPISAACTTCMKARAGRV